MFLATCSICNQQTEFFGIAKYKVPKTRSFVYAHWRECSTCGTMSGHNFLGKLLLTRKAFTRDELDKWFPTTREKAERNKKRKIANV